MSTSQPEQQVPEYFGNLHGRYRPERRLSKGLLDAAPLVDVVLLLLLFFIINTSFVLQPGIQIDLPVTSFQSGISYGSLVVTIAQEGMVFFNDERTTLEGLGPIFMQAAHDDPEAGLLIEADGRVQHGTLVHVYNMATEAGLQHVTLATRLPPTVPVVP